MLVMEVDGWALWSVLIKFLGLLAVAGVVGGSFAYLLADRLRFPMLACLRVYLLICASLGLVMVPLYFLLQVGGINHNGLSGMLDTQVAALLMRSELGEVMALRMLAFALIPASVRLVAAAEPGTIRQQAGYLLLAMATLLLAGSFAFTGHIATQPIAAKMLLMLHVLAVCMWIGALYPLLQLSRTPELAKVLKLMRGFGALALCFVPALVLAGVYLLTQVLQVPQELVSTSYGLAFLLKLAGVCCLLLLAALNKLVLVPRLMVAGVTALQRSIQVEIAVALFVLAVTSWATTATAPAGV